jgi:hypothetical protein
MNGPSVKSANIEVTPKLTPHGIECDIKGGDEVVDEAIWLDRNNDYEVSFTIKGGPEWALDENKPFMCGPGKCPPPTAQGSALRVGNIQSHAFTVEVPKGPRNIFHYRLNFENGGTYDPIIIRD